MYHLTILSVYEVLVLVQFNYLTCEQFGVCSISMNETKFSCVEEYENITRADNLLDLKNFWWVVLTDSQSRNSSFEQQYERILTFKKINLNGLIYIFINVMLS